MKNILILVSCMLLCAGVLCASTSSSPTNLMAQPAIASDLQAAGPGQSAPMPICPPSNPNCYLPQPQLRLQAAGLGQSAPMPICPPAVNCGIQQERVLMVL